MAKGVEQVGVRDFVDEVNRRGGGEYRIGFNEDGTYDTGSLSAKIHFEEARLSYFQCGDGHWIKFLHLNAKTPGIENGSVCISRIAAVEHIKSRLYSGIFVIVTEEGDRHTIFLNAAESDKKRGRAKKE